MPADIPEIQLDANWLEDDMDDSMEQIYTESRMKGAYDELRVSDGNPGGRRKSSRGASEQPFSSTRPIEDDSDQGRLEDQMNYEHLRRLEQIFEDADQDGLNFF